MTSATESFIRQYEDLIDMFRALESPTTRMGTVFVTASGKSTDKQQCLVASWGVSGGAVQ